STQLSSQATAQLQQIYEKQPRDSVRSFESFLAHLANPEIEFRLRNSSRDRGSTASIRAGYAGSTACESCHKREYDTWKQTGMARMLQPYVRANLIGDFGGVEYKDLKRGTVVRMGMDSRPYFEFEDAQGKRQRFSVDYTIGSKFQQGYAVRASGGLYVLP